MSFGNALISYIYKTIYKRKLSSSGADALGGLGSGAGGGGTIREAGGSLGKYGAAKEEEYFYKKQKEQLEDLNMELIKRRKACRTPENVHQVDDIIQRNRKRIAQLEKCFRKKRQH